MTSLSRITLCAVGLAALLSASAAAADKTSIDFYFPVPVQGALAREMTRLVKEFNDASPDVEVVAAYTGSYDDTRLKTQAAVEAGKPPAVTLMSANFVQEFVISGEIEAIDDLLVENGGDPKTFLDDFWPALRGNATANGKIYAIPFQNSTPLVYINVDHFKEAGLDPTKPPATWAEFVDAAKKLTKRNGDSVERYGFTMPGNYDYFGWLMETLCMSNGGNYYNQNWGGEVYYDTPSMLGAAQFVEDLVFKHKVMTQGVVEGPALSTNFLAGKVSMMLLSTGSLSFVCENMKQPWGVAFVPRNVRNAVPIGGASLVMFKGLSDEQKAAGWKFAKWLSSTETLGGWSRFTGYFAPRKSSYDTPDMKDFMAKNPEAKVAIEQLPYAKPWFATYQTVAVRKALEDEIQTVLNGKKKAPEAVKDAQKNADALMKPYVDQTALKVP